jgi:hypothetical protein
MHLCQGLRRAVQRRRDAVALIDGATRLRWAELQDRVARPAGTSTASSRAGGALPGADRRLQMPAFLHHPGHAPVSAADKVAKAELRRALGTQPRRSQPRTGSVRLRRATKPGAEERWGRENVA